MTYIAMYVGGPKDGDREERPGRVHDVVLVATMPGPPLLRVGSVANDMNPLAYAPRTVTYERFRMFSDSTTPLEVYAPSGWSGKQVLERLLEYYRPEQDETT